MEDRTMTALTPAEREEAERENRLRGYRRDDERRAWFLVNGALIEKLEAAGIDPVELVRFIRAAPEGL